MLFTFILATSITFTLLMLGFFVIKAKQYKMLWKDGLPCTGTILNKSTHQKTKDKPIDYYVTYTYFSPSGAEYKNQSLVSQDFYDQLEDNSTIDLVISASKPWISAPAYLIL